MSVIKHQNCHGGCHGKCCLKVEHLTVRLEEDLILDDVGFHLHCGELIALIGPNGAGKSSLFKSILGIMPYQGSISFESAELGKQKPRIGYVPQNPGFDPGDPVSVLDLFVASTTKYPAFLPIPAVIRSKVYDSLKRVNGEGLIDRRVGSLSGGEMQRVLLAMALEPVPNLLILDEPMSGVDMEGEQQLLEHDFSENNPVKPPSLSPTEEEYEAYAAEADTEDYEPVEDFDDDADEEFEDIAPIVSELFLNVGGGE